MRGRVVRLLAFIALAQIAAASAASPPAITTSPSTADLPALIQMLSSDQFKDRQEAQKKIAAMGDLAVTPMKELVAKSTDPEVRTAAESILKELATASRSKGATLVTLHFTRASPQSVYEELYRQAGSKVTVSPPDLWQREHIPPVTIGVDNVPFWTAFETLRQQTNLSPQVHGPANVLGLDRLLPMRRSMRGMVSIRGPYMVVANGSRSGMFDQLTVCVEPKIHLLEHAMTADVPEIMDAEGHFLGHTQMDGEMTRHMTSSNGNTFEVRPHIQVNNARQIAHVKGTIAVTVLNRWQTIEINDILGARNRKEDIDGHRFLVNLWNADPGQYNLILIAYNTDPPTAGITKIHFKLVDANGVELKQGGPSGQFSPKRADYDLDFSQDGAGPPAKLILEFPLETEQVRIPFEFGQSAEADKAE